MGLGLPLAVCILLLTSWCQSGLIHRAKRSGIDNVNNREELWSNMPIPYLINQNITELMRNAIVSALETINRQSAGCLSFRNAENSFLDESESLMEFLVETSPHCTAEATVGRQGRVNYVTLQDSCVFKLNLQHLVIHEVLHILGMDHEHSRPDRDKYVVVNWANIQEGRAIDFYVQNDDKFVGYDLPYDPSSVMHYGPFFFSTVGGILKTIEPVADQNYLATYSQMLTAQSRNDMSEKDVKLLKKMYRCEEDKTNTE